MAAMVEVFTREVRLGGQDMVAEATLNNCSDAWTAVVKAGERLVAAGAGSSPEGALESAIERAERTVAVSKGSVSRMAASGPS
jgi:hypothetical protein